MFPCSYLLQGTALAAGAGSIAGNALYGALKPDSDHKTVIIHENAPVAQAPIPASPSSRKSLQEINEFCSPNRKKSLNYEIEMWKNLIKFGLIGLNVF